MAIERGNTGAFVFNSGTEKHRGELSVRKDLAIKYLKISNRKNINLCISALVHPSLPSSHKW